ncbi:MAG: alpha-E domain-containing protein [Actinomycetota bacterium]
MALLTRAADRIYWAARYLERAEDTSRLVVSFGELFDDLPVTDDSARPWGSLLAVFGPGSAESESVDLGNERSVVHMLVSDAERAGSVRRSVRAARDNLRTCRELLPREAWRTVNDLWRFVEDEGDRADDRRFRGRVLREVIDASRRLDGVLHSTMRRDDAYEMWWMGRYLERADMTTRVVGVRAATLMATQGDLEYDEVHWMSVLRSLSALQMYQRASHGPIDASVVVRFLLFDDTFPRSVRFCLHEIGRSLELLSDADGVRSALDCAIADLGATSANAADGTDLDGAMDGVQLALGTLGAAIAERYLIVPDA